MLEHILVGLDGSELAAAILPYVRTLAVTTGAKVTLVHVLEALKRAEAWDDHGGFAVLLRDTEKAAAAYLKTVEDKLTADGITTNSHLLHGDPRVELPRRAEQDGTDLIALATHGRSGLQHVMYGSVAEAVAHRSTIPLLLINPENLVGNEVPALTRIVVPLDGSTLAEAVLPYAATVAERLKLPVVLLRVAEPMYLPVEFDEGVGAAFDDVYREGLAKVAAAYLDAQATGLKDQGIRVETVVRTGYAAWEIAADAGQQPGSLLILATHGRTGVQGLLLGSVARQVVHKAAAPVLLVPSKTTEAARAASAAVC